MDNKSVKGNKISLVPAGESSVVDFYVVEETRIAGISYLLVTDQEEGDGDAWILKDLSREGDEEAVYEFLEDDRELDAISKVFAEMMEDIDLEM